MEYDFRTDCEQRDGQWTLCFAGELDRTAAPQAEKAALEVLRSIDGDGGPLVIDVDELAFCDSGGVHALLGVHRLAAEAGRPVELRHLQPIVRRVLELTGVDHEFVMSDEPPRERRAEDL
jgi:anti-anti-sigma factor